MRGEGRVTVPFVRGSPGFVEVSISRLGDMLAGYERATKNYTSAGCMRAPQA